MTRWPARPQTGLPYMAALEMALSCVTWPDGRPGRPPLMTEAEAAAFAARWRAGRQRLVESYPDSVGVWATLDEVFS